MTKPRFSHPVWAAFWVIAGMLAMIASSWELGYLATAALGYLVWQYYREVRRYRQSNST